MDKRSVTEHIYLLQNAIRELGRDIQKLKKGVNELHKELGIKTFKQECDFNDYQ